MFTSVMQMLGLNPDPYAAVALLVGVGIMIAGYFIPTTSLFDGD